jgi:hypothetical protein
MTMRAALILFSLIFPALVLGQALPEPHVQTQAVNDNSPKAASTAFVKNALDSYAPITSPQLTGFPTLIGNSNTFTTDSARFTYQANSTSAYNIYSPVVPPGWYFSDIVRSTLVVGNNSTVQQGAAIGAYTLNQAPRNVSGGERNAIGLYVLGINAVDNSRTWGINTTCGDNKINGAATLVGRQCVGWEADFQINGTSIVQGAAFIIQGQGTPSGANGVQISHKPGEVARWTNGFITDSGSISNAAAIFGATKESGSNIPSQTVNFSVFDSGGVGHHVKLQAVPFGTDSAFSLRDNLRANGVTITNAASGGSPHILPGGTDTNINLTLTGKGSGDVVVSSGSSFSQFAQFNRGLKVTGTMIVPFNTPATSSSACTTGQISVDSTYIYTCVATNTWHRVSNGETW